MKIYIGNLTYETTAAEIRAVFEGFGEIQQVNLLTDMSNGRSRGYGFVEMTGQAEGEKAIASLHGQRFNGRRIIVNEARERRELPPPGSRQVWPRRS